MMKLTTTLSFAAVLCFSRVTSISSFVISNNRGCPAVGLTGTKTPSTQSAATTVTAVATREDDSSSPNRSNIVSANVFGISDMSLKTCAIACTATLCTLLTTTLSAVAEVNDPIITDLELTDLPPVYVPVIFGIALVGGVGLLTSSLGNVIDQEANLGMQSGARAKKEIERSRSSYFKK